MKHDLPKSFVISSGVDRGRYPRGTKELTRHDEDGETPSVMGMRKIHRFANKFGRVGHSFDFAVMRRFLMKHRGKPWDQVYSEICKEADDRNYVGHQFRERISTWIEHHVHFDEDGDLADEQGHKIQRWGGRFFYIHPETKTLEYMESKRGKWHEDCPHSVFELNDILYHKHWDGLWYRVKMEVVPTTTRWGYPTPDYSEAIYQDAFGTAHLMQPKSWNYRLYSAMHILLKKYGRNPQGSQWFCVEKQSANKREIAKLKVKYGLD